MPRGEPKKSTLGLRARLRNQTRPPQSHGPPRHDHDHDQATRPNLTVFKHPLSMAGGVRCSAGHAEQDLPAGAFYFGDVLQGLGDGRFGDQVVVGEDTKQ